MRFRCAVTNLSGLEDECLARDRHPAGWLAGHWQVSERSCAESVPDDDDLDVLQDAEDYYLACVSHTAGSPYLFHISAGGDTAGDE